MKKLVLVCFLAAQFAYARPEFLVRYATDPFSKADLQSCATCHLSPSGGGARNVFGKAFAANNFRITEDLRQRYPDRFLASKSTPESDVGGQKVKATWTSGRDNELVLQIGESFYRLNRADGTMEKIGAEQAAAFVQPMAPKEARAPLRAADDLDGQTLPTFEYYLVNLPTNRPRPARSVHLRFSHRFDTPVVGKTGVLRDLFGLDSTSSVSSFGVEVGLTKWLSMVSFRMPIRGQQTIEWGPQVYLLQQGPKIPISLSFRATVEGQKNFTERFTTNLQPVISRSFGTRAELFVVPTFSIAVPRRSLTFDFPITPGEARDNLASIGIGGSIRVRPAVAVVGEWIPRVAGYRGFGTSHTYSIGIQRKTNRHVFSLVFSNNSFSTTTRMVTDGTQDVRIGFNIYRRIW